MILHYLVPNYIISGTENINRNFSVNAIIVDLSLANASSHCGHRCSTTVTVTLRNRRRNNAKRTAAAT